MMRHPPERFDGIASVKAVLFYACGVVWVLFLTGLVIGFVALWAASKVVRL